MVSAHWLLAVAIGTSQGGGVRVRDTGATPRLLWLAKKAASKGPKLPPLAPLTPPKHAAAKAAPTLQVTTDQSKVTLKIKKHRSAAVWAKPGGHVATRVGGPGKLTITVYQVVGPGRAQVDVQRDGSPAGSLSFASTRLAGASASGAEVLAISKPKSTTVTLTSGKHTIDVSVLGASAPVVIELQYLAKGSRKAAPVAIAASRSEIAAVESSQAAEASATPPPDAPLPPGAPVGPAASAAAAPTSASSQVAPTPAAPAVKTPADEVEARIRAGEMRDSQVGTYAALTLKNPVDGASEQFSHVTSSRPYVFVADGPGVVTLRVHRLGDAAGGKVKLTMVENDVLLQSVEAEAPITDLVVVEKPLLKVAERREYRLNLGPKLSRFAIEVSEDTPEGVALHYEFAAGEKNSGMALSLDMSEEMGMGEAAGSGTTLTEVSVRKEVVEIEKVVLVDAEAKEWVGVAVAAGAVVPTWGGMPAPSVGLGFQWVLPFADGALALDAEGMVQRHDLTSRGVDPRQTEVATRSLVWVLPARAGLTCRIRLGDSVRFALGGRGVFAYVRGDSQTLGGSHTDTTSVIGGSGSAALEVRIGVGWWALEAGYLYAPKIGLPGTLENFDIGGAEVGTRFRFVL